MMSRIHPNNHKRFWIFWFSSFKMDFPNLNRKKKYKFFSRLLVSPQKALALKWFSLRITAQPENWKSLQSLAANHFTCLHPYTRGNTQFAWQNRTSDENDFNWWAFSFQESQGKLIISLQENSPKFQGAKGHWIWRCTTTKI